MKGIGLVLGGGGARGFYHVGVLKALQELDVKINEIAGCSMGAVIGAMYAADPEVDLKKTMKDFHFLKIAKLTYGKPHLLDAKHMEKYLRSIISADTFGKLKIPLKVVATDVETAKEVVIDKGKLFKAIEASSAIPGVYPLVQYKGKLLCDGGLVNPVPITLIGRSKVLIVSDISLPLKEISKDPNIIDIVRSVMDIPQQRITALQRKRLKRKNILYLRMDKNMTIFDFVSWRINRAYKAGYKDVMKKKKTILNMIN